jgi:hypothetical protein
MSDNRLNTEDTAPKATSTDKSRAATDPLEPDWPVDRSGRARRGYRAHFIGYYRARYAEQHADYDTVVHAYNYEETPVALRVKASLMRAKDLLGRDEPPLVEIAAHLDLVERTLPWLFPKYMLTARLNVLPFRFWRLPPVSRAMLEDQWRTVVTAEEDEEGARAFCDEATGVCNRFEIELQTSLGLQLERLKMLCWWTWIVLLVLFGATILTVEPDASMFLPAANDLTLPWVAASAAVVAVMGAIGGFISGLLQVRGSRVTVEQYLVSKVSFLLKPPLGAVFALLLYILLSWAVVAGVTQPNFGTTILLAFMSGFSERYFLRLLPLEKERRSGEHEQLSEADVAPPPPANGARVAPSAGGHATRH